MHSGATLVNLLLGLRLLAISHSLSAAFQLPTLSVQSSPSPQTAQSHHSFGKVETTRHEPPQCSALVLFTRVSDKPAPSPHSGSHSPCFLRDFAQGPSTLPVFACDVTQSLSTVLLQLYKLGVSSVLRGLPSVLLMFRYLELSPPLIPKLLQGCFFILQLPFLTSNSLFSSLQLGSASPRHKST